MKPLAKFAHRAKDKHHRGEKQVSLAEVASPNQIGRQPGEEEVRTIAVAYRHEQNCPEVSLAQRNPPRQSMFLTIRRSPDFVQL